MKSVDFENFRSIFFSNVLENSKLKNLLSLVWTSFRVSKWFRRNLSGFGTDVRDDVEDRIFSRMIFSDASYSFASSSFRRSTHNVNSSLINYYESLVRNTVLLEDFRKTDLLHTTEWFVRDTMRSDFLSQLIFSKNSTEKIQTHRYSRESDFITIWTILYQRIQSDWKEKRCVLIFSLGWFSFFFDEMVIQNNLFSQRKSNESTEQENYNTLLLLRIRL